jgi:hypothetical protein
VRLDELQVRDLEVLRTLHRLEYLPTRQLAPVVFPSVDVARRRLRRLSDLGLILPHTRGISEHLGYRAWRLTAHGVDAVGRAFPAEPTRDGLVERLKSGSLANIDHRESLADVYLQLLGHGDVPAPQEADRTAVAARSARLRLRASAIRWAPDGAVVLRYTTVQGDEQVQPDATVTSEHRQVRLFLELDRSTHSPARVKAGLGRYARYARSRYAADWPDGRRASVVLICASTQRARNLRAMAADVLGDRLGSHALEVAEAAAWLDQQLVDPTRLARSAAASAAPRPPRLTAAASHVYEWGQEYRASLRASGKDLPAEGLTAFRQLYDALKADSHGPA